MAVFCPDCNEATNHGIEYVGALLDTALLPVAALPRRMFVRKKASQRRAKTNLRLYSLLERLGMGDFLYHYDNNTVLLNQMLWEEATRRGIKMREFRLFGGKGWFIATLPDGTLIDFEGVPLPHDAAPVWWINNKAKLKDKLRTEGIPVPNGGSARTLAAARKLFDMLETPMVVKPSIGSASRHTAMHVRTLVELEHAYASAKHLSPFVMIEEELRGEVYRPTLVGGKLIATLRRDQACVYGDGTHTIQQLIEEENKNPARKGPYFSPIKTDHMALAELAVQGLKLETIPAQGERVQLNQKINWSLGGTTTDVTEDVHPDNKKLFEDVAKLLHAPLVGIDFIIGDISKSWKDQKRCGIIECNDMPYFDNHHLPYKGKPRDVAGPLWDLVS